MSSYNTTPDQPPERTLIMKRSLISLGVVGAVIALFLVYSSSPSPAEERALSVPKLNTEEMSRAQDGEESFSTFFCASENSSAEEAAKSTERVRTAYDAGGDKEAFDVAEKLIAEEICEYTEYGIRFWNTDNPPEYLKPFMAVACLELSNGHCLSVQPSFIQLENDTVVPGYSLVEPRVAEGLQPPQETEAARLHQGIIFNLN